MTNRLTCAIPKGECDSALALLRASGIHVPFGLEQSRAYITDTEDITFLSVKPQDVPKLVQYGAADIGITGKQHIIEAGAETVELLDLGTSRTRLQLLGAPEIWTKPLIRVATPYPKAAYACIPQNKFGLRLIKLSGSMEAALSLDMCDALFDSAYAAPASATGIHALGPYIEVSDRLLVNRGSYVRRFHTIDTFSRKLDGELR